MLAPIARNARDLIAALLPQHCAGCAAVGAPICARCADQFARLPLVTAIAPPMQLAVTALGQHVDALRSAVLAIKFRHFRSAAGLLGEILARRAALAADYLVPVPLHPARLRERGFNQADDIARGISRVRGIPLAGQILVRCRPTLAQSRLALRERRINVRNAFAVRSAGVDCTGAKLVLVDDVMTTGETLLACAAALRAHGAAAVSAVVLARRL